MYTLGSFMGLLRTSPGENKQNKTKIMTKKEKKKKRKERKKYKKQKRRVQNACPLCYTNHNISHQRKSITMDKRHT